MPKDLVILSAPSGVGKTTVVDRFLQRYSNAGWRQVKTCTTRKPRKGELDGIDYQFLTEFSFNILVKSNKFLEYATVHGQSYGTLMSDVETVWDCGDGAILVIDTQGKETVKAKLPEATTIFLLPPSKDEMEKRLRGRGSDTEDVIQIRLNRALEEIKDAETYDYQLINVDIEKTVQDLYRIIKNTA